MARSGTTLEVLDGPWPKPDYPSHVVTRCHALRKVRIDEMTVEDVRLLVGQKIGLPHILPRAIEMLEADPLAEGDFFPGDLLKAVAALSEIDWSGANASKKRFAAIAAAVLENNSLPDRLIVDAEKLRDDLSRYL